MLTVPKVPRALQNGSSMLRNRVTYSIPDMGVLPALRAAFDPEAESGDFFGHSRVFEMHGYPVKVKSNKRSHKNEAARQLWDLPEKLNGVIYSFNCE